MPEAITASLVEQEKVNILEAKLHKKATGNFLYPVIPPQIGRDLRRYKDLSPRNASANSFPNRYADFPDVLVEVRISVSTRIDDRRVDRGSGVPAEKEFRRRGLTSLSPGKTSRWPLVAGSHRCHLIVCHNKIGGRGDSAR